MADKPRDDAGEAGAKVNDRLLPRTRSQSVLAVRLSRWLDERLWRVMREPPFQFARWLGALATVLTNWLASGPPKSAVAYIPVAAVVALLLLPDARSIAVGGLSFERLSEEAHQRKEDVDTLSPVDELSKEVSTVEDHQPEQVYPE